VNHNSFSKYHIAPTAKKACARWCGLYAGRHGAATSLYNLTGDIRAAYQILGNSLEVVMSTYVKPDVSAGVAGMSKYEEALNKKQRAHLFPAVPNTYVPLLARRLGSKCACDGSSKERLTMSTGRLKEISNELIGLSAELQTIPARALPLVEELENDFDLDLLPIEVRERFLNDVATYYQGVSKQPSLFFSLLCDEVR